MRALVVLGIAFALALLAWLMSRQTDEPPAPAPADPAGFGSTEQPGPGSTLTAERIRFDPDEVKEPAPPPPATTVEEPSPPAVAAPLQVEVWNASLREPVAEFRYVLELADGTRRAEAVRGFQLELALDDRLLPAELRVEAAGYEPAAPVRLRPQAVKGALPRRVWLTPAAHLAGVEFWVQQADGSPVEILDVTALREDPVDPTRPGKFLWRRQASEPTGIYPLPDLDPGRYLFRLREVDADGRGTTHLAHEARVTFGGTENMRTNVRLEAGGIIDLGVTDASGNPVDEDLGVRLVRPGDVVARTIWTGTQEGETLEGADLLPAGLRARSEPLLPGIYRVQVQRRNGTGAPAQEVAVVAGQVTAVTLSY